MSENSSIQWTTHTFNPWWGCTKVHAGCTHCYAETLDKRFGASHWGNNPRRMVLGEWGKPAKWDAEAERAGERHRVFCASMCDMFEDYDGSVVDQQGNRLHITNGWMVGNVPSCPAVTLDWLRSRVFTLIHNTPNLEWLLLTKRPENIVRMVPPSWLTEWPANVMTGTSPCNQETADKCIPDLLSVPGRHFLSVEPMLGPVDLRRVSLGPNPDDMSSGEDVVFNALSDYAGLGTKVDWVIVGGESGPGARPCDVAWVRSVVAQCKASGVPCFVKQLGAHVLCANDKVDRWIEEIGGNLDYFDLPDEVQVYQGMPLRMRLRDRKGGDMAEWPEDLRVREFYA